ncbi:SPOR domain-containing protein [Undibacterium sp. Ren11W]|uniref:SPOR domain-containing protein n=1 Tax=Undibacterium sp. Ren11W TaxID=3413045 RepID=UPI003BF1B6FC
MGLLSLFKQKQETSEDRDSGEFRSRSEDETSSARGDKKSSARASKAARKEKPEDPALPEKKRARRRLIGALALVLAAIIGLPMLLDSEPKPLADDINIQIPSKDKVSPLPAPLERAKQGGRGADESSRRSASALDSTDGGEEIITAPGASENKKQPKSAELSSSATAKNPSAIAALSLPKKDLGNSSSIDAKAQSARSDIKADFKSEPKSEPKLDPKSDKQTASKVSAQQVAATPTKTPAQPGHTEATASSNKTEVKTDSGDEAARALAILEAKPASKSATKTDATEKPASHYVVQVAALATQEKVAELQAKLNAGGVKSYTQKVATTSGEKIRVRVGPFNSKEEAEKARLKLSKLGLGGTLIPN